MFWDDCLPSYALISLQASKNNVLEVGERLPQPPVFDNYQPLFASYVHNAHAIVQVILERLNQRLGLVASTLTDLHQKLGLSQDHVRLTRSPPQPIDDRQTALGAHTDYGSITLLFNRLGGLQVYPPPGWKDESGEDVKDW